VARSTTALRLAAGAQPSPGPMGRTTSISFLLP
jgi:hypothetical protein